MYFLLDRFNITWYTYNRDYLGQLNNQIHYCIKGEIKK